MHLIFVFLFNLLLFNGCLAANIDRESSRGESQQPTPTENQTKTKAIDEDFLYATFDGADLEQILKFTKDPRVSDFVKKHIFPVKYQNFFFTIVGHNQMNLQQADNAEETTNGLRIYGYNLIMEVIQNFSQSIKRLSISFIHHMGEDRAALIYKLVNEHCSESLNSLNLGHITDKMLTQFEKPFSKVTEISVDIRTTDVGTNLPFNELFPNVQAISLIYLVSSAECNGARRLVECDISHMEHLNYLNVYIAYINENHSHYATVLKQLTNIFRENPQIQTLEYQPMLGDFVHVINEYLPNLEHLSFTSLDPEIKPTRLDHVQKLRHLMSYPGPIERLLFPRLEWLAINYLATYTAGSERNTWIEFFRNHQHLRKLNCSLHTFDGLVEFLAELPHLEEIRLFQWNENVGIDFLRCLFEGRGDLVEFEFNRYGNLGHALEPNLETYRKEFAFEWHITHKMGSTFTFKRKD